MKYTDAEVMRMTLRRFNKEYKTYKDDFDFEMMLRLTGTTYEKAKIKAMQAEEWF